MWGNLSAKKTHSNCGEDSSEKEQSHSQRCHTKSLDECKLSQAIPCHRYIGCGHYEKPSGEGLVNNNNSCESDQNPVPVNSSSEIDWSFWNFDVKYHEFINFLKWNTVKNKNIKTKFDFDILIIKLLAISEEP